MRRIEPSPAAAHVRIGSAYIPRQRVHMDADARRLQVALLECRRQQPRRPSLFTLVLRSFWTWC